MKKHMIFLAMVIALKVNASHIVGGEIMYKYVSVTNNMVKYNVTLYVYIDCDNGTSQAIEGDKSAYINIYTANGNKSFTYYDGVQLTNARTGPVKVSEVNYKCIKDYPAICVSKYTYTISITVPVNTTGYVISFERCCRNKSIGNLVDPSNTGAIFWSQIPGVNTVSQNSSPVFKGLPANLLCLNAPVNIDHSADDADGDSLAYELYTPYNASTNSNQGKFNSTNPANYGLVNWASSYSLNNQIDGSPSLSINRKTGKLLLTPTKAGQFVVGIKVLEFRKGVLIGETKRDYQFNVTQCVFDVVSSFGVPLYNCSENDVVFQNRSQGGSSYHWDFGVDTLTSDTSNKQNPIYVYKNDGYYTVRLIAKTSICADTSEFDIYVKRNFKVNIGKDTLYCGGPFSRILNANAPNRTYIWNTGEKTESININKGGKYIVKVSDLPCITSDTINITNDLSRIDLGADSVICRDSFVQFRFNGLPGYKSYRWSDGTNSQGVFVSKLDRYWVDVLNVNNCPSSDTITFVLYPPPRVFLNDTLFCRGTSVKLDGVNYSLKTIMETFYLWNTEETTPQITVSTPGLYTVKVRNRLCTILDSAVLDYIVTGLDIGRDTFYCGPVLRWLKPRSDYIDYVWDDQSTGSTYLANSPGKKMVTITTKEGCIESDSVLLTQYPNVDAGLGNDTAICLSSVIELTASHGMLAYRWNTGAISQSIHVKDQGEYIVIVRNKDNCIVSDTITIIEDGDALPSAMYMPNVFTPNDDGINEFFPGNGYKDPGTSYHLVIYNRWGEKIFESSKPENQWNGWYKDKPAPQEEYIYYVKYLACDEKDHWFRGTFSLIK